MQVPYSEYAKKNLPGSVGLVELLFTAGIALIPWFIDYSKNISLINKQNECDYDASIDLGKKLSELADTRPTIMGNTSNVRVFRRFSVGEVTRHFDVQTNSQITGWLNHNLHNVGWGVGFYVGSSGISTGRKRTVGNSAVDLNLSGTSRDNLIGDGFIAVLEENSLSGNPEIIRLIVPPDPAALEDISSLMTALGKSFGEESYRDLVLKRKIPEIQKAVHTNTSYVSHRLNIVAIKSPD